jgi:hypothetical protein
MKFFYNIITLLSLLILVNTANANNKRINATSQYYFDPSTLQQEMLDTNRLYYTASNGSIVFNSYLPNLLGIYEDDFMAYNDSAIKNFTFLGTQVSESKINTYNTNGKLVKQLEMQFNFSTNAWDTKFTKYISYLANNNYASILTVIPNMIQGGLDSSKKIITYTGNNITNILQMDREALATSWINLEQNTISYDANNNEKTVTNQNFDIATTTWKNVMKDELYYNGNNKIIVDSNFIFDTVTNAWVIGGASKVSYDNNNFRKNIISVFYDGANVDSIKINFMVDADGDMTKQEINNVLFGIWVPIVTTNYYYEQKPAQVPNAIKLSSLIIEVNTYPNPVQDKLLVNVTCNNNMQVSCNIIDMQGRQMMKNNMKLISGKNQKTITTEALPIGMYLLVIQSANGDYVCKKFNKN